LAVFAHSSVTPPKGTDLDEIWSTLSTLWVMWGLERWHILGEISAVATAAEPGKILFFAR